MKRMLLILNPKAGRCKGVKKLADVIRLAQAHDYLPTVLLTGKTGDAQAFAQEHGGQADLVCCVGGDGTFSEVVSGMIAGGHRAALGYIPAGSTNDYAASLGLPPGMNEAAVQMLGGRPMEFDVGVHNGRPFTYVAAFGMPARASYSAPQDLKNALGHFAYVLEGICDLHMLRPEHVVIDTDDEHIEGDYLMGTISNTTSIGGFLRFSPDDALLNDGFLEMMLISMPANARELTQLIQAFSTRSYADCGCITFRRSRSIRVAADSPMAWTVDGEYVPDCCEADIQTLQSAIRVMVPQKDD